MSTDRERPDPRDQAPIQWNGGLWNDVTGDPRFDPSATHEGGIPGGQWSQYTVRDPQGRLLVDWNTSSALGKAMGYGNSAIDRYAVPLALGGLGAVAFGPGLLSNLTGGGDVLSGVNPTSFSSATNMLGGAGTPASYWDMLAQAGGTATDAAAEGAPAALGAGAVDPYAAELAGLQASTTGLGDTGALGAGATNATTSGGGILDWIKQNPTAAGIAGNLIGGGLGALGSVFAANTQAKAGQDANQAIWNMYQQNRADLEPWRQAGVGALGNLTNLTTPGKQLDTAMLDPGYQFRYEQGLKELDNRLKGAGKFYSGTALKGGQDYAQNFATGEFGNVFNRNAALAGLGQVGTTAGVAAGSNAANNVANNLTGIGNARASGYVGGFNALSGGLSNAINNYQEQTLLDRLLKGRGY